MEIQLPPPVTPEKIYEDLVNFDVDEIRRLRVPVLPMFLEHPMRTTNEIRTRFADLSNGDCMTPLERPVGSPMVGLDRDEPVLMRLTVDRVITGSAAKTVNRRAIRDDGAAMHAPKAFGVITQNMAATTLYEDIPAGTLLGYEGGSAYVGRSVMYGRETKDDLTWALLCSSAVNSNRNVSPDFMPGQMIPDLWYHHSLSGMFMRVSEAAVLQPFQRFNLEKRVQFGAPADPGPWAV